MKKRTKKIVITSLKIETENENELKEGMCNFIRQQQKIAIDRAIKLGEKVCLVKLEKHEGKVNILKKKIKLNIHKQRYDSIRKKHSEGN